MCYAHEKLAISSLILLLTRLSTPGVGTCQEEALKWAPKEDDTTIVSSLSLPYATEILLNE